MQAAFNTFDDDDETSTRDATTTSPEQDNLKSTQHEMQQNSTNVKAADSLALNGRPVSVGLRRQPTIYPHGLGISVQTLRVINVDSSQNNEDAESYKTYSNYSRASTLRSENWHGHQHDLKHQQRAANESNNSTISSTAQYGPSRKYRISMIDNPESLAELQVRRYKYPLTGNYYLDQQDQKTNKVDWFYNYYECAKRYCRWKYVRWPILFLASVLLFFGLITYCMWLHDVSIARQRYLQQRRFELANLAREQESSSEQATIATNDLEDSVKSTSTTTARSHRMQESTLLRAIGTGTRSRERPKEQTLTTNDYGTSKGAIEWEKQKINQAKKTTLPVEDYMENEYSDEESGEDDYAVKPIQQVHFTSGHQNSFGVPIEEDEQILRVIDAINQNQPLSTALTPRTKVSPTIPPVKQIYPTTAMDAGSQAVQTAQDNGCYSTSLPMCRGVLEYDLTYNATTQISNSDRIAFENLIHANCSARAVEFLCALLEPECRPKHIGILPPCRRICKAILEACSIEISNSDILSNAFDCSLYPDSNDPQRCEDPTRRRDFCFENEFECYDHSCIPQQWQCDNIKDCATGEDEDECLQCDHQDEFRCRSNDKCVPETVRCDSKFDCFDGSDEDDCEEYGSGDESAAAFDEAAVNSFPHVFSYASYLSPNQTKDDGLAGFFTTTTADEETSVKDDMPVLTNRTSGVSKEEVNNNVPELGPKGFVNFRDSKEIMMTSDSENKFKYSAVRGNRSSSRYTTPATLRLTPSTLQPAASRLIARTTQKPVEKLEATCAPHQLRCISGKCITVAQLCDKKIDCPDGADELMCVYKQERSTTRRYSAAQIAKANVTVTTDSSSSSSIRNDRRTIRTTTLKRRLKV